jgi:hypothetical protein
LLAMNTAGAASYTVAAVNKLLSEHPEYDDETVTNIRLLGARLNSETELKKLSVLSDFNAGKVNMLDRDKSSLARSQNALDVCTRDTYKCSMMIESTKTNSLGLTNNPYAVREIQKNIAKMQKIIDSRPEVKAYDLAENAKIESGRKERFNAENADARRRLPAANANGCITADCAAGIGERRGDIQLYPDYLSGNVNLYVFSAGGSVNLHNGKTYGQYAFGRSYPGYSKTPGFSVMAGRIVGGADAQKTDNMLSGAGSSASYLHPVGPVGIGGGVNHSYGGDTSIEGGFGTPGGGVSPFGYGSPVKNEGNENGK